MLEPTADGFRNYFGKDNRLSPAEMLVDRANLLTLTVPEMTVLVGGMRALDANAGAVRARRVHRPARHAEQRLLRQPAGHVHEVVEVGEVRGRLRGTRPHRRASSSGRPRPSTSCSVRIPSCARSPKSMQPTTAREKFVQRLRRRMDQGDEPRPLHALTHAATGLKKSSGTAALQNAAVLAQAPPAPGDGLTAMTGAPCFFQAPNPPST